MKRNNSGAEGYGFEPYRAYHAMRLSHLGESSCRRQSGRTGSGPSRLRGRRPDNTGWPKALHTPWSPSSAIGYSTLVASTASPTFLDLALERELGLMDADDDGPRFRYFAAHARTKASVRSQLMQVYVQKSTRTTIPRSRAGVRGDEFGQPVAPSKPGR